MTKLMQYNLEFCGMGLLPIVLHTNADVARALCHKRGVGRSSGRQALLVAGGTGEGKLASDMLTHSPSAEELRKFLPMIGCHTIIVNRENYNACSESDCILNELGRCSEVF